LEKVVKERTAEVVAQKEEIAQQNEEIRSSINYASRIQSALLTPKETIDEMYDDYFILFLPRDIVSGDFYWHAQAGNRKICVVADCTGHGVPGGFMSMLGIGFLTQIMTKGSHFTAAEILNQLRDMIIESLHQTGKPGESKDGMDLALYIIDTDKGIVEFAGANNPLVLIRDNEIIQYKPDKMPIGIHVKCDTSFTNHIFEYKKGDVIYTFSDGYPDQFGGPTQRKFMIKRLKELLLEIHQKPMEEQKEILHKTLLEWEGEEDRIDDVVLMGLRL
ncbi:MAG: SpoIIE family protein phosphatase, partial [Perlabentimonas sp.]